MAARESRDAFHAIDSLSEIDWTEVLRLARIELDGVLARTRQLVEAGFLTVDVLRTMEKAWQRLWGADDPAPAAGRVTIAATKAGEVIVANLPDAQMRMTAGEAEHLAKCLLSKAAVAEMCVYDGGEQYDPLP